MKLTSHDFLFHVSKCEETQMPNFLNQPSQYKPNKVVLMCSKRLLSFTKYKVGFRKGCKKNSYSIENLHSVQITVYSRLIALLSQYFTVGLFCSKEKKHGCNVKSSHIYLYSAFHNTDCIKAASQ